MAQHVQDSQIIERRLRPIYDALDVSNYKKALQEAEKVLKKSPGLQCARALKALALLRMNKYEESEVIVKELAAENPFDDGTLQVMTFCYRELDQLENICVLYKNAVKQAPGCEEILSHLFMAYVRVFDFKSQHSVALQLYKLRPKNPYYFWSVISVVLQALRGPDKDSPEKSSVFLALATRMIEKLINEDKLDAEQEIQLHISILQHRLMYKEALEFLDSPLGNKLWPSAPVSLRLSLLKSLGDWCRVHNLLKELLEEHPDRWDYYQEYIKSVIELQALGNVEDVDSSFEACHEFLCHLIESDDKKLRGPYLGRLELHRVMKKNQFNPDDLMGDYLELLVEYFRFFGDRGCCTNDIALFLDNLNPKRYSELATRLIQECGISPSTLPQDKQQMQKHICSLQISRICGAQKLGTEHLMALYSALSLHYEKGKCSFGADLLPTDMGPSDAYALLAVHVMYDIAIQLSKSGPLCEALCQLQYLLTSSPSNFHAKLLSLQIYHILGCGTGAHQTYELLDVKHVQLDSMGYLHCARLPSLGQASIAKPLYDLTLKFFTGHDKDGFEYLAMCYKFGSFSKLFEFMDFNERLSNSLYFSLISTEALLLELVCLPGVSYAQNLNNYKSMNIDPKEDRILWDYITDNRDLSVMVRWNPKKLSTAENGDEGARASVDQTTDESIGKESFEHETELLKIRSTMLRLVASCVEALTKDSESFYEDLNYLKISWNYLFDRIEQMNYKPTSNEYVINILPSRLFAHLRLPYKKFFGDLADLVLALKRNDLSVKNARDAFVSNLKNLSELVENNIMEYNDSEDPLWSRRKIQENIVGCIEILSLTCFVLSICYEKFSVATTPTQKRNKKKQQKQMERNDNAPDDTTNGKLTVEIIREMKNVLNAISKRLDTWRSFSMEDELTNKLLALSMNPKNATTVNDIIRESHSNTLNELKSTLREKIRMLNKVN